MRVLLVTNHFLPEEFKCNSMVFELQRRGHEVTVLTGIPDYPKGEYFDGYGVFRKRVERINGVKVIRAYIFPRGKAGKIRLVLNYVSITLSQAFDAFWLGLFKRLDRVLVYESSPVMVGIAAGIVSRMQHIPMLFWCTDLWPESLSAAGGISNPSIIGYFTRMVRKIYRNSTRILITSEGFRQSIEEKGDFADKIVYFPQWADAPAESSGMEIPALPEGFKVMFAGNIGEAQDFEHILEAARILKDEDIHFVILGDGRKRPWSEEFVREHGLGEKVHFLGRFPAATMPAFFAQADLLLVTLKDELIFNLTLPAKVQSYMAAGKPIVAMMNGEGPRVIAQAGCGMSAPAGDARALSDVILQMKSMDGTELAAMGTRGQAFCETHFKLERCIDHLEQLMKTENQTI
ncbi:MAG: glycosyltransferase family 4 protein [Bacteroidales bacterium]|nr:glycosyltransferase family 4 protein [Bacteroidales bacterium]